MFAKKKDIDINTYTYEVAFWITGESTDYTKKSLKEYDATLSDEKIDEFSMRLIPIKLTLLYLFLIVQYENIRPIDILSKKVVETSKQVFKEKNYSNEDITELIADQIYYHDAIMDDMEYIKYTGDFFIRSFKDSIEDKEKFLGFLNEQLHLTRAVFEIAYKTGFTHK